MTDADTKHWARVAFESSDKLARQLAISTLLARAISLSNTVSDRDMESLAWLDGGEA